MTLPSHSSKLKHLPSPKSYHFQCFATNFSSRRRVSYHLRLLSTQLWEDKREVPSWQESMYNKTNKDFFCAGWNTTRVMKTLKRFTFHSFKETESYGGHSVRGYKDTATCWGTWRKAHQCHTVFLHAPGSFFCNGSLKKRNFSWFYYPHVCNFIKSPHIAGNHEYQKTVNSFLSFHIWAC